MLFYNITYIESENMKEVKERESFNPDRRLSVQNINTNTNSKNKSDSEKWNPDIRLSTYKGKEK